MLYKENMVLFMRVIKDMEKEAQISLGAFMQEHPVAPGNQTVKVVIVVTVEKIPNFLRATDNAPITEKELEARKIPCSYSDQQYINLIFRSKAPEYRLLNVERYRQDLVSSDHHLKVFIVEERVKPLPEQIAVKAE